MGENERVRIVRKAKGLTLERFGELIGMGKSSISDIENGRRLLTNQSRLSICREFGVSETWLRTGEGEMFTNAPNSAIEELVVDFYLDAFDEALIREYLFLTPNQRKIIRTFFYRVFMKSTGDSGPDELLKTEMGYLSTAKTPQEMTDEELHAELDRQLTVEREKAKGMSASGRGGSGTAAG